MKKIHCFDSIHILKTLCVMKLDPFFLPACSDIYKIKSYKYMNNLKTAHNLVVLAY